MAPGVLPFAAVAFTLRVTQGPGENDEFSFDGGEARLGRTADNDVVIKDPSSSRSHARVYEDNGAHFVEDLKSANGTRVNDKPVKGPKAIVSGDTITIGDVVLLFEAPQGNDTMMAPPSSTLADEEEQDPNATILKPPSKPAAAVVRKPPPRRAPTPPPEEEPADEEPPPEDEPGDEAVPGESTKNFKVPPPKALQRRGSGAVAPVPSRPSRAIARPAADAAEEGLSAAERARQRRELQKSAGGRAQLLWSDLSKPARIGLGIFGAVVAAGVVGLGIWAVIPKKVVRKNEPIDLRPNGEPVPYAFGEGDVDFPRPDLKTFTFSYASPTSIVGVLHYQARDISKDEVTIELNGTSLGVVPPDTVDVQARQLEVVLPATVLKLNEPNELTFDNVGNPPGDDPWRVWNIWVEVIPVPQMSAEEASTRAKQDIERAEKQYEMRQVGAMNLFRSWKGYRDAWLLLEATPDRPKDLLLIAQTRMRELRPELDRKCSAMLVDYQKAMNMKYPDIEGARLVLHNISNHFEKEHPCYTMSRGILRELDALDDPGAQE